MSATVDRFLARADQAGVEVDVATFPEGTRTAEQAAAAVGCEVARIVKSLVFVAEAADGTSTPVLALVSGAHRADTGAVAEAVGAERVRKASADEARVATGYAIGGTPPFGHATALPVVMDATLLEHGTVWAAAGTPTTVFEVDPALLREVTGAVVADLAGG